MSTAAQEVQAEAADVLADIMGETAQEGEPAQQERAVEHLQNLGTEAPEEPEPPVEGDPEDVVELPPPAPEEYLEPDFEAEVEAELSAPEEEEDFEYADDERLRQEIAARKKAEKKAAHYEALRAKDASKLWLAEALDKCPLAVDVYGEDLSGIKASSKKAFMRQAAEGHNLARSILEKRLDPERQKVTAEAKAAAQKQFGKPTTGPAVTPAEAAEAEAAVQKAVEGGSLKEAVKAMWTGGQINP